MTMPNQPPLQVTESGREALRRFHKEITIYCRELPRLLTEGEEGRFVLIEGEQFLGVWDTLYDAFQHGRMVCGDQPLFVHQIDSRDQEFMPRFLRMEGYSPTTGEKIDANAASSASS